MKKNRPTQSQPCVTRSNPPTLTGSIVTKRVKLLFAVALMLTSSVPILRAQTVLTNSVGVNFNGVDGGGIDNAQSDSLLTGEVAGAPTFTQTNWNNIDRYGDVTSGFLDSLGAESGLHIMWDSVWSHSSGVYGTLGTPDGKLMDGFNDTDWAGGPPGPLTAASVYGAAFNQKPLIYIGGLKAYMAAKGVGSYSVILYVQGWHGWWGASEHWVQAVSGNPSSGTMVPGADITPHMFSRDTSAFGGTYTQVASTCTNLASASGGGNFIVLNGLTNDAILLRTAEPTGDYQAGKIMAFQIVPTPQVPITTKPDISPSPAYALSPVTLTEAASSFSPMTFQWETDGGSGGSLTNIPNATNSTLTDVPPDLGSTYSITYDCVAANSFGSVTSVPSVLTVNAASAPIITRDTTPVNIFAYVGGTVTFDAALNGTQPLTNQWQVNKGSGVTGIGLTAITNRTLVLSNVQLADSGSYDLTGTNSLGSLSSTPATLTVLPDPLAPIPSQASAYDITSKSPLAYWRLNEMVDPTAATYQAYDASGHGLNAIYGSGVTTGNAGPQSPAFVGFESTNTAAGFTQNTANGALVVPPLNLNSPNVTITAWIYPTSYSPANGGLLVNRTPVSAAGLGFGSGTDTNASSPTYGQAELGYVWNNNGGFHSGLFPPLSTWSFVALSVTSTNATLYLCYFDGVKTNVFKKVDNTAHTLETFGSGSTTWLGGDSQSTSRIFNGSIDEVAVFGSTFSDDEVMNVYFAAQGGGTAPSISTHPVPVSTFAGQWVTLSADGIGYPAPTFQWQGGTGGVFHNVTNDSHLSGANSGTLTIHTSIADAMDYRLVLANANGYGTSSVATVSLAAVPLNGLWTVNFSVITGNNGAPNTPYSGQGVLGNGTYWNGLSGGQFANSTSYCDDGVTPSGINLQATNYPGSWFAGYPMHNALMDPYVNTQTGLQFTNLPNGTYNLVVYGISGPYVNSSRGTRFTVNGVSRDNVYQQDSIFAPGDNTALFENVHVTNGGLLIQEDPIGLNSDSTPNTEPDFNGVQIQAVSLDPVTVSANSDGTNVTLSWPNYGTLMSATNMAGPWAPVSGAVSPFQVSPTNAPSKYFRVKIH